MAVTLLDLVSRAGREEDGAASSVDAESTWSSRLRPSVAPTSDFVFRTDEKTKTGKGAESDYLGDMIVRKDGGWDVSVPNVQSEDNLVRKLKQKLKLTKESGVGTFTTKEFMAMVMPALEAVAKETGPVSHGEEREEEGANGAADGEHPSGEISEEAKFMTLLRKVGHLVGRRLLVSIINCTLGLQAWNALKVLMQCGLVASGSNPGLVATLVEHRKADLIALSFHFVLDLTPGDLLTALKFLLDTKPSASVRAFDAVREEWRRVASTAIDSVVKQKSQYLKREKAIERELRDKQMARLARRRAERELEFSDDPFAELALVMPPVNFEFRVPLFERQRRVLDEEVHIETLNVPRVVAMAVAVDGFQGWETCLHSLLASGQDEAVLAAIIAELETSEAVQLLQYLRKWLVLYSNQLARNPSPKGKTRHPAHNVPSSQQVLQWTSMVLDGQYTKCVLSSEFLPELRAIQKSVESVVAIGKKVAPLLGTIEHLREQHALPSRRQDSGAHSAYTIEYLDIS